MYRVPGKILTRAPITSQVDPHFPLLEGGLLMHAPLTSSPNQKSLLTILSLAISHSPSSPPDSTLPTLNTI